MVFQAITPAAEGAKTAPPTVAPGFRKAIVAERPKLPWKRSSQVRRNDGGTAHKKMIKRVNKNSAEHDELGE